MAEDKHEDAAMAAWITVPQAIEILGISKQAIHWLRVKGHLIAEKRGRDWWLTRASVEAWKETRERRFDGNSA